MAIESALDTQQCETSPRVHLDILAGNVKALRHRGTRKHECHEIRRTCLWQRQLVHDKPLPLAMRRLRLRGVHVGFEEKRLDTMSWIRQRDQSDPEPSHFSHCVPLVWLPLWGYNIGEFYQNSLLSIAELNAAGVIDKNIILAPEV